MCKDFCCSTFLQYEGKADPTIVCDLDNTINPTFTPQTLNIAEHSFARVAPAFRLASKALLTDAATKYLVTMSEGDLYTERPNSKGLAKGRKMTWEEVDRIERELGDVSTVEELRERGLRQCWVRLLRYPRASHPRIINQEMRSKAERLVTNMTGMIDIVFGTSIDHTDASSKPIPGPLPPRLHCHFPRGSRSQITINKKMLKGLGDPSQPGMRQLKLAETLLHEFAHAVQMAVNGSRSEECYYKNRLVAEAGFDFTSSIFGGIFNTHTALVPVCSEPSSSYMKNRWHLGDKVLLDMSLIGDWPSMGTQKDYEDKGINFGSRLCFKLEHVVDGCYPLPGAYVQSLFTNAFWDRQSSKYSATTFTDRNIPFWYTGLRVEVDGKSLLLTKMWSKDDAIMQERHPDCIHAAVAWRSAADHKHEDPIDVLDSWLTLKRYCAQKARIVVASIEKRGAQRLYQWTR